MASARMIQWDGSLALHTVYASRDPKAALDPTSPQAILSPLSEEARQALSHPAAAGAGVPVVLGNGKEMVWKVSAATRAFLAAIDGRRSNAEIARSIDPANEGGVLAQVAPELRLPLACHWLVARMSGGTAWPVLAGYRKIAPPLKYQEPIHLEAAGCRAFKPL